MTDKEAILKELGTISDVLEFHVGSEKPLEAGGLAQVVINAQYENHDSALHGDGDFQMMVRACRSAIKLTEELEG